MKITINGKELLKHLTEFHNITDEEIEKIANGDVQKHLLLLMERDFVLEINTGIIKDLLKWRNESDNSKK